MKPWILEKVVRNFRLGQIRLRETKNAKIQREKAITVTRVLE